MTDNATPNGGEAAGPRLSILTQYVKDLSFENPRAPLGLQPGQGRPEIQIQVDVQARQMGQEQYEVVLDLKAEARTGDSPVFLLELSYGAVFTLANIPADSLQPLLFIECPRLLFPFARRIVADATRDGGFPPLMIDPIDFVALYRRRLQPQAQAETDDDRAGEVGHA
jgi:preprotein translocase subunit SecB